MAWKIDCLQDRGEHRVEEEGGREGGERQGEGEGEREGERERDVWWRITKLIIIIQGYTPYRVSVEQIA